MIPIVYAFRTLVVSAEEESLNRARLLCAQLAQSNAGTNMFIRALRIIGQTEASHYISSGFIDQNFAAILPFTKVEVTFDGMVTHTAIELIPGNPQAVYALTQLAGLFITLAQIDELLSYVDASEQSVEEAMVRLDLEYLPDPPM